MTDEEQEIVEMERGSVLGQEIFKSLSDEPDGAQLFAAMECLAMICRKRTGGKSNVDFEEQIEGALTLVMAKAYDIPGAAG